MGLEQFGRLTLVALPALILACSGATQAADWGRITIGKDSEGWVQVDLENSVFRARISHFRVDQDEHALRELVIKGPDENQILEGDLHSYLDAAAHRPALAKAELADETADSLSVALEYRDGGKSEMTIFRDSPAIRIRYLKPMVNSVDIGIPGGGDGVYVFYGGDTWHRSYVEHPKAYYDRFPGDVGNSEIGVDSVDAQDGGSLNYKGSFIMGVYNPANGRGFGRVAPVDRVTIIKLLTFGPKRGFELFPWGEGENTQYLFAVTGGGRDEILKTGKQLAEGTIPRIALPSAGPQSGHAACVTAVEKP